MACNRADDQEISMLSLHLVQLSLVYVNTLMIQQVLAEPAWGQLKKGRSTYLCATDRGPLRKRTFKHGKPFRSLFGRRPNWYSGVVTALGGLQRLRSLTASPPLAKDRF